VLIAAEESPEVLRAAMQAGVRDVLAAAVARAARGQRARRRDVVSRAARPRRRRGGAAGVLGGQLVAVAGSKGGVGTTTIALHLACRRARRARAPVCVVTFDLQKGDFRRCWTRPYRRSVVDLVDVAGELSVRHLRRRYTHSARHARAARARRRGARRGGRRRRARSVLTAVKARHALTVVDLGALVTEASAIGAEIATKVLVVTTPDVLALRGVRRLRDLWSRLQVREPTRTSTSSSTARRAGARSSPTSRARSSAGGWPTRRSRPTSPRSRRRSTPARRPAWRRASCAARSRASRRSSTSSAVERDSNGTGERAACSAG
jgi:pilus assembly protein CpaE